MDDPVDRYFAERGVSAGVRSKGLHGILASWDVIAHNAERYDLTLDDWLNDLDLRDIIAGAMAVASDTVVDELRDPLAQADDTFRAATVEVKQSLWGAHGAGGTRSHDPVSHWWYFRYPRRPGFSMRRDLESAGIARPTSNRRKR